MNKKLLFTVFFSFYTLFGFSQIGLDSSIKLDPNLPIENIDGIYYNNDVRIVEFQIIELFKAESKSQELARLAKKNKTWGQICLGSGIFLIGSQIGRTMAGQKFLIPFAGLGAGLVGIAFPLFTRNKIYMLDAIDTHNESVTNKTGYKNSAKPEYQLAVNSNGIGLAIQF